MKKTIFLLLLSIVVTMSGFSQNVKKLNADNQVSKGDNQPSVTVHPTVVKTAVDFGVTPALRDLPPAQVLTQEQINANKELKELHERVLNADLKDRFYPFPSEPAPDPVWQKTMGTKDMNESKAPLMIFDGQASAYMPSDCNGAVGPNHYMQGVNSTYAIYNKSGVQVVAPTNFNTLFSGVLGATYNNGDIIVMYDEQADRWFASEFSLDGATDYMLIAVSTTNDPTGTWYKWSFDVDDMPDYMKFGVWEDGYYMATNNPSGDDVYVFERSVMLAGGASPQMVGFDNPNRPASGFHCIMPIDCDGTFAPAGEPGQFITINDGAWGGADQIWVYELDVNWTTPASSTFARVQQIGVPAFDSNFGIDQQNISQLGGTQQVDAIPQIFMWRAQYRNFGGSQAIVCAHTVDVDATDHAGIRWYELQNTGTTWSIRQTGTYAPDAHSRWLASIAMDINHNIGIGYSISSSTMNPGIRYTGQTSAENALASGLFDVTEEIIQAGSYQPTYDRWGDYSEISLDPVNDITFWFTTEYYNSGKKTKVATFQFSPSKPYTNFKINTPSTLLYPTTILTGQVATYVDLTIGTVTNWLWTFQSGTPASVTTQNSGNITYNTAGLFDVTLKATNTYGDSTLTKYDYIRVINPGVLFCDTMTQFYGNPTIYTSTNGYVGGTNEYGCSAIAEKFENYTPFNKVTGGRFYWAQAYNGTSPDVTFAVWGDNGAGQPGTQLATKTIPLSSIVSDYTADGYTDVMFDSDVILPSGAFFIGFEIPGSAASGDTLAILTNNDADGQENTGYSLYSAWETYAAWGMSMMNAIFPFGCYDPAIPPVADFVGTPLQLPAGNTVTFTDLSYGSTPTTWSWSFTGGTPATSPAQNPVITYNAAGVYAVSLTVSNANGSDIETKNGYVEVLNPNSCSCGEFDNVVGNEVLYTITGGYVSGNNGYGDKAKAEYFGSYAPFTRLEGAWFSFGRGYDVAPATNLTINVWNNTGTGGAPGTIIGTETVPIATIATNVANGDSTWIEFDPIITLTTPIYIGFMVPNPAAVGDTVAVKSGAVDSGTPNTAWEMWSTNAWYAYSDASSWGGNWNLAIYPTICTSGAPIPDFYADNTVFCESGTVHFTDITTCGPTAWSWSFPGGTPATSTAQNPTVTYSTPGLYDVSLQVTNASGSNTKYKAGFVYVSAPPTITMSGTNETSAGACDGTATAIPSGTSPFSYLWDVLTVPGTETFDGLTGAYNENATTYFNLTVSGLGTTQLDGTDFAVSRVCMNISQDRAQDLDLFLLSPDNTSVELSTDNGGSNDNYTNVCFDMSAATAIEGVATALSGDYRPSVTLNNFHNNQNPNGVWRLRVTEDNTTGNGGNTVNSWSITFNTLTGSTNQTVTGLCNGTYNVTVTDDNGCTNTNQIILPVSAAPVANFSGTPTSICAGASVNFTDLSTNSPTSWAWTFTGGTPGTSNVQNPTGIVYNTPGTYAVSLTVTNANGNDTETITGYITVNALPTAAIAPATATICAGQSQILTASGGTSYLWSTSATTAAITVTPAATTTYTVTVTNAAGCTAVTSRIVTVNALPTAAIAPATATICAGQSQILTASGGTTYLWSTTATTPAITVTPAATTTYTVTVTNAAGCSAVTSRIVTVNALPTAAIAPATATICAGQSQILTASGGTTYLWSTTATTPAITVTPAATTTYTVTVTNAAGCSDTESRIVTVNAVPTAAIAPATATICAGQSQILTASGGTTYLWSTSATTPAITVTPAATTTYTVTVTNAAGCSDTESRIVTVNALPTAAIAPATASICAGQSQILTASGGTTYLWSTTATTPAITVTPAATTTYTVTVTNAAGCSDTESRIVTVNALPTAAIAPATATICAGQSQILTASGGTTYLWSTTATTPAITVTPAATTTYTVTVTNAAGCSAVASRIVTVNAIPTAAIAPATASICAGQSQILTASGGTTYLWSTSATTPAITVTPAATTTYTVTVTNAAGCTDTESRIVTVNALPTAAIAPATATICAGQSQILTASGGTSYLWSTSAITAAITVTPAVTTTYTVTVTNAAGCADTESRIVTVNAVPTAAIAPATATICAGQSQILTASGGTTYLWSTTATTPAITVTPASTTTYTVTVTNAAGCSDTESRTVTVNALPTAVITGTTSICAGNSTMLTASGGTAYVWSTGATTAAITVNPASTTTYSVTVTNASTCSDTESAVVTVNPLPTVDAGTDQTIPNGTSTTLNGSASGGSGTYNYLWSPAGSLVNPALEDPTTTILTVSTTYTLTVTDAVTGCQSTDVVVVNISGGILSVTATATPTAICLGASTQLNAVPGGGSGSYTYTWASVPAGFSSALQNPVASPTANTTYYVTVYDGFTNASNSIAVTVNALPTALITGTTTICAGNSTILTASGGTAYTWSTGGNTAAITVSPAVTTTYTVTVTNAAGCTDTENTTVTVNNLPTAAIAPATSTICAGQSQTLTASGGTGYLWSTTATTAVISVTPASTTIYTVTVTNAAGCTDTESRTVTVNSLPTAVITGTTTICAGSSTTITASGGTGYLWSTTATTTAITVTPATTTTYTVTVTNTNGCTDTENVIVTVNSLPPASAGTNQTICLGDAATLTATGGSSYIWSTGGNTATIVVGPTVATTYTVTVSNGTCTATDDVLVDVLAAPVADAGSDASVCLGGSVTLTASGGTAYAWSSGDNSASTIVSPTINTTYTVTVSVGTCSSTDDVLVTVNSLPTAAITGTTTICEGSSTTLTASGGTGYLWSTTATTTAIPVTPATTTTYIVTVTNANGCTDTENVIVTVNSLPVASAGTDQTICLGDAATLTATGGSSYTWSTGGNTATIVVGPTIATTYTVTVSNGTCTATDDVLVDVMAAPVADAGSDVTICSGESVTLTASGGTAYAWSSGDNTESTTVSPTISTTYTVTVSVGSCSSTDDVFVTVIPSPTADAGSDVSICEGESVTLTAAGGATYEWSSGDNTITTIVSPIVTTIYTVTVTDNGCSSTDDVEVMVNLLPQLSVTSTDATCGLNNGSAEVTATGGSGTYTYLWDSNTGDQTTSIASGLAAGSYTVTVNDGICENSATASVSNGGAPIIIINSSATNVCSGQSVELIASGADSYIWIPSTNLNTNTGDTVISTPVSNITYIVEGTTGSCTSTDTISIMVNPIPNADFTSTVSNLIVTFTNNSTDATSYSWDFGDGFTSTDANPWHNYASYGSYYVVLIATNSCGSDTITVLVDVITSVPVVEITDKLNVYPNPTSGYFVLEFTSTNNQNFKVDIINIDGQVVYMKDFAKDKTEFKKVMDINNLAKGTYTLQVTQGENTMNTRFILIDSKPKMPEKPKTK